MQFPDVKTRSRMPIGFRRGRRLARLIVMPLIVVSLAIPGVCGSLVPSTLNRIIVEELGEPSHANVEVREVSYRSSRARFVASFKRGMIRLGARRHGNEPRVPSLGFVVFRTHLLGAGISLRC
jgi:hypothetical protein